MELIIYNRLNTMSARTIKRAISVSLGGGVFYFPKPIVSEFKFKEGDKVLIAQQKGNLKNWFFVKADQSDESAFELKEDAGRMVFRCTSLARTILTQFENYKSLTFLVEKEPTEIGDKAFMKLIPVIPNQNGVKKLTK